MKCIISDVNSFQIVALNLWTLEVKNKLQFDSVFDMETSLNLYVGNVPLNLLVFLPFIEQQSSVMYLYCV